MDPGVLNTLPPLPDGYTPFDGLMLPATPPNGMMPVPVMPKRNGLGPSAGATKELPTSIVGGGEPMFGPFSPRPELMNALINHESGGNPNAIGKKGERGLGQIMPSTAAMYGISDPTQLDNPDINRQISTRYFSDLLKRYKGNEYLALMAYNEGPGNIDKGKFFPASIKYANTILDRAKMQQQQPLQMAQPGGTQAQPQQQPGVMAQLGGMAEKMMGEGTAEAEELPPLPQGFTPMGEASTTEVPTNAPTPPPVTPAPTAPQNPTGMSIPSMPGTTGFPPGMHMSIGSGPFRATIGSETTTGEATKEEALRRQAIQLINLGNEMNNLYEKRIKPKLDSGDIHSLGEGLIYSERSNARSLGYNLDPDVEDWIVKAGQFSNGLNSYYAAQSGGKGGISYLEQGTQPHVPHPPSGLREVFGIISPTGSQWDLQQQGEQLPIILHNLKRDMGIDPETQYKPIAGDWVQLPSGKMYNPKTGQYRNP